MIVHQRVVAPCSLGAWFVYDVREAFAHLSLATINKIMPFLILQRLRCKDVTNFNELSLARDLGDRSAWYKLGNRGTDLKSHIQGHTVRP